MTPPNVKDATEARASWSTDEQVIHVDEHDHEIDAVSRDEAHGTRSILHRAFAVFLFDERGDILLCRRSPKKRLWPLYWTDSCSGHPFPGEETTCAAERRVTEELGCATTLTDIGTFIYKMPFGDAGYEHELCHVLVGKVGSLDLNQDEVCEVEFVSPERLAQLADDPPPSFAPWLVSSIRAVPPLQMREHFLSSSVFDY